MFQDTRFMSSDVFIPELDFGVTMFDSMYTSFLAILEGITASGWSDMYIFVSACFRACLFV